MNITKGEWSLSRANPALIVVEGEETTGIADCSFCGPFVKKPTEKEQRENAAFILKATQLHDDLANIVLLLVGTPAHAPAAISEIQKRADLLVERLKRD